MPSSYSVLRFHTTRQVFSAIPPRMIQVTSRILPESVNPAKIARIA